MKKRYFIAMLPLLLACSDWLNIQPALEIREDKMFENEEGFKSVLTGAYTRMATPALYGKNMTMTLPEFMTRHWTAAANTLPDHISRFDYEQADLKELLATIWLEYYQTIANLNILLARIDDARDMFSRGNHALIKGEALGLRAFLHFEVLRLWGDIPANIVPGDPAIPYMTTVTKNPNTARSLPYSEVLRLVLADLDAAEELLADDPITSCFNSILNAPALVEGYEQYNRPEDPYHYYRQNRFNYYAVKATKARYYHWLGDRAAAARLAGEVIDAVNVEDGSPKFTLGNESAALLGRLTFPTEHLFALHNARAQEVVSQLFIQSGGYTLDSALLRTAYEVTAHPNDIRFRGNRLWQTRPLQTGLSARYNYFKKYVVDERTAVDAVPVIRLAEMYFIAIENGDAARFPAYRVARNLGNNLDGELTSDEAILDRLEKEYRKEFYGEGQMFYFYKRHARDRFTWPSVRVMDLSKYKLPLPEAQTLFE
jgi:hypothetical protein